MITFKKYLELLNEAILTPQGTPISTATIGKIRTPQESGFCQHNPKIRDFAQQNPVQMFIVLAFVFFTMMKEWYPVVQYFESFIKWLFEFAIPKDDWRYKGYDFSKFPSMFGTGKDEKLKKILSKKGIEKYSVGSEIIEPEQLKFLRLYGKDEAQYIAKIWKNRKEIYNYIMDHLDDPKDIFMFLTKIKGLQSVKAAFATQLILGKFGCIDSVNTQVYKNILKKFPNVFDKEGRTVDSIAGKEGYLDFLKALEDMFQQDVSQTLWDDWCEIIDLKILNVNESGENKKITVVFPNGENVEIDPYKLKSGPSVKTKEGYEKLQKQIKKDYSKKPVIGMKTSEQHMSTITNPEFQKYNESREEKFQNMLLEILENKKTPWKF